MGGTNLRFSHLAKDKDGNEYEVWIASNAAEQTVIAEEQAKRKAEQDEA